MNKEEPWTKFRSKRMQKRLLLALALFVLVIVSVNVLTHIAEKEAITKFKKLNGTFGSIKINILSRSVSIKNIAWQSPNQQYPHQVTIANCKFQGIGLFQLIFHKRIYIEKLLLDSGKISYNQLLEAKEAPSSKKKEYPVEIENIIVNNLYGELRQDSVSKIHGLVNASTGAFVSTDKFLKAFQSNFNYLEGSILDLTIKDAKGFYTTHVNEVQFDSRAQRLQIDSLTLIPQHTKYQFARKWGQQIDRIDLSIQKIDISRLDYPKLFDSLFSAGKISVTSADLLSFRDKRIPDGIEPIVPMPMTSLARLPFAISIDSIVLTSSKVTVEEFAVDGFQPGYINFQQLTALMTTIDNRYDSTKARHSKLVASGNLMGTGLVKATFSFPLDGSADYLTTGSLRDFRLADLNPMLENIAQLRIEEGHLKEVSFNFRYNDRKSIGSLAINYKDLKLQVLKSDKGKSENYFKSWLINALVMNTKDKSVDRAKRTGLIELERDRKRFIFNIWWKSIRSGLQSSFLGKSTPPLPKSKVRKN